MADRLHHRHDLSDPELELDRVRSVLRSFLDAAFRGDVPDGNTDELTLSWVARVLAVPLDARDVASWSPAAQRALYEMLAASIIELRVSPPHIHAGFLNGSRLDLLGGPLERWVAERRESPLLLSRMMRRS